VTPILQSYYVRSLIELEALSCASSQLKISCNLSSTWTCHILCLPQASMTVGIRKFSLCSMLGFKFLPVAAGLQALHGFVPNTTPREFSIPPDEPPTFESADPLRKSRRLATPSASRSMSVEIFRRSTSEEPDAPPRRVRTQALLHKNH
jgi:hypothetical protein